MTTPESAPLLDLQALVVAVRRRRRLWCATAVLGLTAGASVPVLLPPAPTAVAKVLVAHQADQPNDPGTLIRTDVALLSTTRIADAALKALRSPDRPEDFMGDYSGLGLTNNLLQITVTGATDAQAVARAKALADAFVADHVRRIQQAADAEAKGLLDQRDRLEADLARVNQAITDGSGQTGPNASADQESLFARRAELTARITDFGQRAAEARIGTPRLVAGTQIVDAPRALSHSLPKAAATDGVIGLVLGFVLGLAVSAVGTVVADRPVLRREIAANLNASAIAELPLRSPRLWGRRRNRAARERLTASLARTVRASAEPVSLLALGCARGTGVIALDLARALVAEGPVTVVDALPGSRLAKRKPQPGDPTVVTTAPAVPAERQIGVGSVAPGTAWTDLRYLGTKTVLVVRAGHGSAAWLHTVARQLADQRVEVVGVVLIDPDPRDRTDGTLWAERPPAPPRLLRKNGVERLPKWATRVPDSDQEAR
ncbi:Wzz/FepE/Etk N-terminal domain-containing protein [Streptomyces acidiscabies]|uniref:Wzz/FepE/Etk N-terminal domain-containing protein n=1 Tax=Streptomyces acidiscabies TaxID=42234 RepID=A0AAP6BHR6_9ACTN|nr:Wzz/FepE/Etk N-terminal domain-containing protein [Streptomyces acidiscabies]MBP5942816.1 polysaccharide biosynthesis protein [Streptomyces sp. LBUM 1476]MBZ3918054.1 polysaccharide biosynthesis protein [Streptomyces acidiscabies]MDX2964702.1 Wzz/FepE/Etk N-terminal domain-containing protein [Streptomyces acidiscabies]MDX3021912.1 Wzz/FepE/Etk N-terminal domain-containing protein [Streptomyces acidiscabies]MDX3789569.1 Wzz/FepE/Etk N-terminal domain-containing protein [Streptomyces acidisca